ncbi:MFS general substrate transporter [Roridomyces roridus]|uniref:MFS general substrate transporter n=1 Tax=Roridomyces roridus TaxID=1738132 RepID=A0AAD7FUW5_9AGAR|nr:MFS general substrate transporter [Roridomyces roridus]
MSSSEDIQLAPLPPATSTDAPEPGLTDMNGNANQSALPPIDGGFGAWSFLVAAFVIEAVVYGFPFAYGVFLDSYLHEPRFSSQKDATSLLPLIGTLSLGIIYCSGVVVNPIATRYPRLLRPLMWLGAAICCLSLFGASYATKVVHLILLQGVLYSIGGSLLYLPCMPYMSEWFVLRRGLALGIIFAGRLSVYFVLLYKPIVTGTAAGGLLLPFALPPLISRYGISKTMRILSVSVAILLLPLLPLMRGRLPLSRVNVQGPAPRGLRPQDWMKNKAFLLYLAVNTLQGFAYFVPIIYLPTFANYLHLSPSSSAITLAMFNVSSFVSGVVMGHLSDRVNPWLLALSTLLATSLTTFILWGVLSHSFAGLLAFSTVYGSIAGGWSSAWTGFVRPLARDDLAMSTRLYGYLLLSRGIGNIVSTPISSKLFSQVRNTTIIRVESTGFDVADGRFENMIIIHWDVLRRCSWYRCLGLGDGRATRTPRQSELVKRTSVRRAIVYIVSGLSVFRIE